MAGVSPVPSVKGSGERSQNTGHFNRKKCETIRKICGAKHRLLAFPLGSGEPDGAWRGSNGINLARPDISRTKP